MATEADLYELLGRAMADPGFRAALAEDPAQAAASVGMTLTAEDVVAFKASDLSKMAEGVDERLSKACRSLLPFCRGARLT